MPDRFRLVCIPSRDRRLAADADALAERIPPELQEPDALRWFATAMAEHHPDAVVHRQDELGCAAGVAPVWYVIRQPPRFRIDTSVVVRLPPDAAFDVYTSRVVEWQTAIELRPRRGDHGLAGTEYDADYLFLGRRYHGTLRIVAADPPRSVTVEAAGSGIRVWYVTSFLPTPEGTCLTVRGDYDLPAALLTRIADRLGLERAIARDIERANETYRRLCAAIAAATARRARRAG